MQLEVLSKWNDTGAIASLTIAVSRAELEDLLEQLDSSIITEPSLVSDQGLTKITLIAVDDA